MKEGLKFDGGKPPLAVIFEQFPRAIEAVSHAANYGHKKYELGDDWSNWSRLDNAKFRYKNAGARHMFARLKGEEYDNESGLPHIFHEIWNKLAEVELELREKETKAVKKRKKKSSSKRIKL